MLLSNIPAKIAAIFAASGTKNTIPLTTAGVTYPNNASFDVGFPPITMTPVISGGLPPFGADMNGILNDVTAVQQWQSAGGLFQYDAAFSTAIGGYPMGALLLTATGVGMWQSTADNNTSNPDTGGANWVKIPTRTQVSQVAPVVNATNVATPAASTTYTTQASFTAPCAGYVVAFGALALGGVLAGAATVLTKTDINGTVGGIDTSTPPVTTEPATLSVASGATVTATFSAITNSTAPAAAFQLHICAFFLPNP